MRKVGRDKLCGDGYSIERYRVEAVEREGFYPDVRIYRKSTAPRVLRDLQRWANNRFVYKSTPFMDYIPRVDGKTIRELYF